MHRVAELRCPEAGERPAVVKRGSGPGAEALRHEATRLRAAAHPGVVEVLRLEGDGTYSELHLGHGGRPVGALGPLPLRRAASIVASAAATLADLHDRGVVHGHLDPTHVLVGSDGRAVLCGFGADDAGAAPADDVHALGAVLRRLLEPGLEREPRRGPKHRAPRGRSIRPTLMALVDQAQAELPSRRPTARRLAAALAALVDEADPSRAAIAPDRRHRTSALAAAVAAVLVLALAAVGLMGALPASRTVAAIAASSAAATTASEPVLERPCVQLPGGQATVGCATPVEVEGTAVRVGDRRFEVGEPGDVVVLGDWDCDGGATPAVLRPTTGEVFVFSSWITRGEAVVRPTRSVASATSLQVRGSSTHHGCDLLVVQRRDGSTLDVRLGPVR